MMASFNGDISLEYRHFFETFAASVSVNDPLPVKVGSHSICENEFQGAIIDWTSQYLQQKNCPTRLLIHLTKTILGQMKMYVADSDGKDRNLDKGFEPVKLMQLVILKMNNLCADYLNNKKFEDLCSDLKTERHPMHPVSFHAVRNGRRKMEDRHVVLQDLNAICSLQDSVQASYYAVFDGHAGTDAAFYAAAQLHEFLIHNKNYAIDTAVALKEAFVETDNTFLAKYDHERLRGGTTAVVCLIRGDTLFVAWLGDSQCILVRDSRAVQLVDPHKPDKPDEKKRIQDMGGEVLYWDGAYRVNGQLAVSRAIGDANYKPYVTAEPDVLQKTLDGSEDFLVIACDGLWDVISSDEACFIVLQYLHHEKDIGGVSARLVQAAKGKGSSDNITVVVVFLRDPSLIARRPLPTTPPKSVESPIGPTMEEQQQELSTLAEKWAWTSSAGFEPIHDLPWESAAGIASAEQDLLMAVGDDELKASNLDAPSDCQWQCKDAFLASLSQQQNGCDVRDAAPQAAFHLSSDGSTWDQSGNVVAAGVDWDQYDEEVSGQASLMFVEKKKEALDGEQDIELINGSQQNEEHNVWESGNSVAFPKAVDELVPNVPQQQPDFQWNLHAPEFQFRPSTDRKLSATELLVKSSSDAELAVLLAAANDDPDGEMDVDDVMSPRYDNYGDPLVVHGSNGDVEAEEVDSEEEDWTFHRGAGQDNEESAVDSEPTESSLLKEAEADKVIEVCNSATCQADELGDRLERLAVDDAPVETTEVVKPIQLDLSEDRNLNSSEEQRIEDVISTFPQSSPHKILVGSQEGVLAGESGLVPEKVELVTNVVSGDNVVMEEDSDAAVPVGGQSVGAEDGPLMQNQPVRVEDIPLSEQNNSDPFPAGEVPVPVSDPMFLVEEQIPVQNIAAQPQEEPTLVVKESVESTGSREWRQSPPHEIAKSTSILEQVSVAEPTTVVEEASALSEEAAPVVEEVPVAETAPIVEEATAAEAVPVVEEAPAAEAVPLVEETPAVEAVPVVEEAPAAEAVPVVEEILVAGAAPVEKETTMVDVLLEKILIVEAAPIEAGVDDSALPVESNVVAVENEQLCQPPSPISDAGATIGSDSVAAVAIGAVATALVSGVVAPAGRASPTKKTTTVKAAPVKEPAKKAETTRRPPAESKTDVKPTRPTKLSPLRKAAPASPKPMVKAAPKTTSLPPKPAVPLATTKAPVPPRPTSTLTSKPTTLVKKTTTTFNAARPTAATSAKKVTAATTVTTESHTTTSAPVSKTSITKTTTVTATRVFSAAAARKASPTVNGTGRPASAPPKPAAAAVNGDAKGKSIVSTTRTVTKTVTSTATVDAASTKTTTTKVSSLAPRPTVKSTTASPVKSASSAGPSKAPPTPASRVAKGSTAGTCSPTKILKE